MLNLSAHKRRHKLLHKHLDELFADWITHIHKSPTDLTILELLTWANEQCTNPTQDKK